MVQNGGSNGYQILSSKITSYTTLIMIHLYVAHTLDLCCIGSMVFMADDNGITFN